MGETVSMPVRAFLDSDIPIRRKEKMEAYVSFNARQGIS